jgi:hypothetical protein
MIGRFNIKPTRIPLALPPPSPRKLSHTRTVVYKGYDREDGLWDIEAELTDVKPFTFSVPNERAFPANQPIHHLQIRLTVDKHLVIQEVVTSLDQIPHAECVQGPKHMHKLQGSTLGRGWRKTIDEHLGRTEGCTHLRELLFNMATAAFQTVPAGEWQRREAAGLPQREATTPPPFLGQCTTWAFDSPTVERAFPMFFKPKVMEV